MTEHNFKRENESSNRLSIIDSSKYILHSKISELHHIHRLDELT